MREHGLLERILLIYGEIAKRLESGREFPPETLSAAADITRICIEEYHGKLEEEYIFPFFEKAGPKVDLVKVLRDQHAAGRRLTDDIRARANAETLRKPDERKKLSALLFTFIFMYRPHAAREDTVLFPAVRGIVPAEEFDNLRGIFEQRETDLFGAGGFEKQVGHITELEKTLGISDLAQFTPPWGRKKQGK
jgi:hemerythrin-like domain-containing protein